MADAIKARHFPMPLPVLCSSAEERDTLHQQTIVQSTLKLGAEANVTFVGIGELGVDAPLCVDGILAPEEMTALMDAGATGESAAGVFGQNGALLDHPIIERVASVPIPPRERGV